MPPGLRNLDASQVKYRITLEHERITAGWKVFLAISLLGQQQARVEPVNGEVIWHLESGEPEILGLLLSDPDKSMTAEEIARVLPIFRHQMASIDDCIDEINRTFEGIQGGKMIVKQGQEYSIRPGVRIEIISDSLSKMASPVRPGEKQSGVSFAHAPMNSRFVQH